MPSIETHVFMHDGQGYVLMPVTNDQMSMLARRAGACIDVQVYDSTDNIYRPAYAASMEDRLSRLAPGFLSDLVVHDSDPFTCPPHELLHLRPTRCMVDGEWVFQR